MKTIYTLFFLFLFLSSQAQSSSKPFLAYYEQSITIQDDSLIEYVKQPLLAYLQFDRNYALFWSENIRVIQFAKNHLSLAQLPKPFSLLAFGPFQSLELDLRDKWQILDTRKWIGSYHCQLAQIREEELVVDAWFSKEIPFGFGPGPFGQLPGLIIALDWNQCGYKLVGVKRLE